MSHYDRDDDGLVTRAVRAYYRRFGNDANQPAHSMIEREYCGPYADGYERITLANSMDVLAVYRVRGNRLRYDEQATAVAQNPYAWLRGGTTNE
jgi:hypothetical protein